MLPRPSADESGAMITTLHTLLAVVALATGAWNLAARKGTRRHRQVGYVYVGSMTGMLLTSFFIFELFGGFGVFHGTALLSGVTLGFGIYFPLRRHRHPNWIEHHYFWMSYSYVGLVMAGGSHLFGLVPGVPWLAQAFVFWGMPYLVGSALIYGFRQRVLGQMRAAFAAK